jgi:hypothetical protein
MVHHTVALALALISTASIVLSTVLEISGSRQRMHARLAVLANASRPRGRP